MDKIRVLIVDDEPIAREILESYIQKMPSLQLIGKCKNAPEAMPYIHNGAVDLMLLDINMPEITGIDFVKMLKQLPWIVFTTAYTSYAVESYELNAVDYLLKPIAFDRFIKAIDKVSELQRLSKIKLEGLKTEGPFIFVKSEGRHIKVQLSDIYFIEGLKDYVKLHTAQGKIVMHSTMKNLEENLSSHTNFLRVHKSYIINTDHVDQIGPNDLYIKGQEIAIGSTYKNDVQGALKRIKAI